MKTELDEKTLQAAAALRTGGIAKTPSPLETVLGVLGARGLGDLDLASILYIYKRHGLEFHPEVKFTDQQLNDFKAYEVVRAGGKYNMLNPMAQYATGLTKERFIFVMNNYDTLKEVHNG